MVRPIAEQAARKALEKDPNYNPKVLYMPLDSKTPSSFSPYAIAATTGLGAYAASGNNDNANAMPLGNLTKGLSKAASSAIRSEEPYYALIGQKLNLNLWGQSRKPFEVVDVLKDRKTKDLRYLIVKDETGERHQLPMTNDYLNVLLGAKGTQKYLQQFEEGGFQDKKYQALRSLNKRENQREAGPIDPQAIAPFKAFNEGQASKAMEIDPALVNNYVYVQAEGNPNLLYMPKPYADFLAKKGYVTIKGQGPK
jgi:hypothetical protein